MIATTGQEHSDPLKGGAATIEFVPKNYFTRLDLFDLFRREAPLEVDLGCGEGAFLVEMARRNPDQNFLGVERLRGRIETVCRSANRHNLTNLRVVRIETRYAVEHLLPPSSVAVAHVLFPDPWPKRYHHPRRLIQAEFLAVLHRVLRPGGELHVKTDDLPYFQWMDKAFDAARDRFDRVEWLDDPNSPLTNFERRFVSKGLPIHCARLRKI